ncbi:MAG TPA: GGDEF domain-containing protein [Bacilli bacterium]|nr:GGDEF domain-containing protein [Bacilli bacterium]
MAREKKISESILEVILSVLGDKVLVFGPKDEMIYPTNLSKVSEVEEILANPTSVPNQFCLGEKWYEAKRYKTKYIKVIGLKDITEYKVNYQTDLTTGLLIKKAAIESIANYLATLTFDKGFAFIIIDINDFKKVNDSYGHSFGDLALNRVAQIFLQNLRAVDNPNFEGRATDIIGRFGGDEFIAVLKNISPEEMIAKLEFLTAKIDGTFIPYNGASIKCPTVSIGAYHVNKEKLNKISASIGDIEEEQFLRLMITKLLEISDSALYQSKENPKTKSSYTLAEGYEEKIVKKP